MLRWTAVTASVAVLVALTAAVARPATTPPITDADGAPMAGSIAELTSIDANGHELGLMIRGHDTSNPVVLFLAGGPGGSERGAMRNHLPALEEYFTVATLDQRGTGTSYPALDPTDTYTLDSAIADVTATVAYLRDRFGQERVVLLGQSWGTLLGVLAVQREPALYSAFVGTGQMVSPVETDRIIYADTLSWARRRGMTGLAAELEEIGPPPYSSMLDYETALSSEHAVYPYDHTGNSEGEGGFSENFLVPEYSLVDQVHLLAGFMDTFGTLYPRIQDVDLRRDASALEVPVFFVQGAHEARGRAQPFEEWYSGLVAPRQEPDRPRLLGAPAALRAAGPVRAGDGDAGSAGGGRAVGPGWRLLRCLDGLRRAAGAEWRDVASGAGPRGCGGGRRPRGGARALRRRPSRDADARPRAHASTATAGPSVPSDDDVAAAQAAAAAAAAEVADITARLEAADARLEVLQRDVAEAVAADEAARQQLADAESAVARAVEEVATARR